MKVYLVRNEFNNLKPLEKTDRFCEIEGRDTLIIGKYLPSSTTFKDQGQPRSFSDAFIHSFAK